MKLTIYGRNKSFLDFLSKLQSFLFQNFATNAAKVRNGHFWTILNEFNVFLIFKGLNEKFFGHKIFLQSKYITGFKKIWGNFVVCNFSKKLFLTGQTTKKTTENTKTGKY